MTFLKGSKLSKVGISLAVIVLMTKASALLLTLLFSRIYGANQFTDAYYAASSIPNLINGSLAVSSLTLFIPIYSECFKKGGEKMSSIFSSNILNSYFLFNVLLAVLVCIFSPFLAKIVAPGFDDITYSYTNTFVRLLSLSFPLTIATQVLINVCNANRKHIVQASLTLMNHVLTILLLLLIAKQDNLLLYPFICLFAWAVQLFIQYVYSRRFFVHRFLNFFRDKHLKKMVALSIPVIIATSAEQLNLTVDTIICSTLNVGSISYLGYSHKIHVAILGTFTSVLMTIFYPIIAREYNNRNKDAVYSNVKKCIDMLFLIIVPVLVFLVSNGDYIINILYGHGAIDASGLKTVSILFIIYSTSLLFASIKDLVTKLYYVLNNTKIPMFINLACVIINIVLSLFLKDIIGIYGIALATSISTLICAALECACLMKKVGGIKRIIMKQILDCRHYLQITIASILCLVIVILLRSCLSTDIIWLDLSLSAVVFVICYIVSLCLMKNKYLIGFFGAKDRRKMNE